MVILLAIGAGIVFLGILCLMNFTNLGIRGIKRFDQNFKLFDMQLHYAPASIHQALTNLGIDGRNAYRNYLLVDYLFILSFLVLMILASTQLPKNDLIKALLISFASLRALFDIMENTLLLYIMNDFPLENKILATICSYATTLKFICLFVWLGLVGLCLLWACKCH